MNNSNEYYVTINPVIADSQLKKNEEKFKKSIDNMAKYTQKTFSTALKFGKFGLLTGAGLIAGGGLLQSALEPTKRDVNAMLGAIKELKEASKELNNIALIGGGEFGLVQAGLTKNILENKLGQGTMGGEKLANILKQVGQLKGLKGNEWMQNLSNEDLLFTLISSGQKAFKEGGAEGLDTFNKQYNNVMAQDPYIAGLQQDNTFDFKSAKQEAYNKMGLKTKEDIKKAEDIANYNTKILKQFKDSQRKTAEESFYKERISPAVIAKANTMIKEENRDVFNLLSEKDKAIALFDANIENNRLLNEINNAIQELTKAFIKSGGINLITLLVDGVTKLAGAIVDIQKYFGIGDKSLKKPMDLYNKKQQEQKERDKLSIMDNLKNMLNLNENKNNNVK
jgi:hypothetical protein